jgi:hypothetical protein
MNSRTLESNTNQINDGTDDDGLLTTEIITEVRSDPNSNEGTNGHNSIN